MASGRSLDLSNKFVLSSGTVAIDYTKRLVLIMYSPKRDLWLLPKGRKNAGESLEAGAIRETLEESGYAVRLLKHDLPTKATETQPPHSEPMAVQQRMLKGFRKIIFWYLAEADSTETPHPNHQGAEDFVAHWFGFDDVVRKLSFSEDQDIVKQALLAIPSLDDTPP